MWREGMREWRGGLERETECRGRRGGGDCCWLCVEGGGHACVRARDRGMCKV